MINDIQGKETSYAVLQTSQQKFLDLVQEKVQFFTQQFPSISISFNEDLNIVDSIAATFIQVMQSCVQENHFVSFLLGSFSSVMH